MENIDKEKTIKNEISNFKSVSSTMAVSCQIDLLFSTETFHV